MSRYFAQHLAALRSAVSRLVASPLNTLLSLIVIGTALALPSAGWVVLENLRGITGTGGGVALVDGNGATALIHNVTTGQLQNLIVNSANNRNLRQDMELNLYLPDLAAMQSASSAQQRAAQMTYDLNTTLVGALGR